jgi:REP-associated tyrosine transposase
MARPLRFWEQHGLYHLIFKATFGQVIFVDDDERRELQRRLGFIAAKYGMVVLAFAYMDNHVHLLIRVGEGNVSKAMQELIGGYARWWNHRHGRRGNLFQCRFWDKLVRSEKQFLVTARYIDLNPVAAGMRASPEDWEWSSARAHLGLAHPPRFLANGEFLRFFAPNRGAAIACYAVYLREGCAAIASAARHAAELVPELPRRFELPAE